MPLCIFVLGAAAAAPDGGELDAAREACCFYRKSQTVALVTLNAGDPETDLMLAGARQAAQELGVQLLERPFLRNYQEAAGAFPQIAAAAQGVILNAGRADPAFMQAVQGHHEQPLLTCLSPEVVRRVLPRAVLHLGAEDEEAGEHAARLLPQGREPGQRVLCAVDIAGSPAERARCAQIVAAGGSVYNLFNHTQDIEQARAALAAELRREPRVTGCFAASAGAARVVGPALAELLAAGERRPRAVAYGLSESLWGGGRVLFDHVIDPGAWGAGYMAVHSLLVYLHTGNVLPTLGTQAAHFLTGPTIHTPADFGEKPRLRCQALHLHIAFCPESYPAPPSGAADCPCVNRTRDIHIALNQHQGGLVSTFWGVLEAAVEHFMLGFAQDPPALDYARGGEDEDYDARGQAAKLEKQLQRRPDALGTTVPEQVIADVAVTAGERTTTGVYWTFNAGWNPRTWAGTANRSSYPVHLGQDEYSAGLAVGIALSEGRKTLTDAVCIIMQPGVHLLQRCQGFADGYKGVVHILHTTREKVFVELIDNIAEYLIANPGRTTVFTLGPAPLNALLAAGAQASLDLTAYTIATMDFDPQIAQGIEDGTLKLAVHQQQYLQGYYTVMGLYVGVLTHAWNPQRSILPTGPRLLTATRARQFACEMPHNYPLCELPEEREVIMSGSGLPSWVWVLVALGGVLIIAFPPVLWHLTSNWRRVRKLHSRETIAVSCAESIAAMRLEEVAYIREIQNPDRIQRAFIDIIAVLTEYRAFLPQPLLLGCDDTPALVSIGSDTPTLVPEDPSSPATTRLPDSSPRRTPPPQVQPLAVSPAGKGNIVQLIPSDPRSSGGSCGSGQWRRAVRHTSSLTRSGASLDGTLCRKVVSVLWAGRARTHDMLCHFRASTISAEPFNKIISAGLPAVDASRGVVDHLSGDRLVASFGAARSCGDQVAVARCARAVAEAMDQPADDGLAGHVGTEKGSAYVGTLGTMLTRKHTVLGAVTNVAYACSRIARQHAVSVVAGPMLMTDTTVQVFYWALCVCRSTKLFPSRPPHVIVLYEMIGVRPEQTADEWMYQLARQEKHDPYAALNTAFEEVAHREAPSWTPSSPAAPAAAAASGPDREALLQQFMHDGPCTSIPVDVAF